MYIQRGGIFSQLTPVVKMLLIANISVFFLGELLLMTGFDIGDYFALYYFKSEKFYAFQYFTYMFMHGNFSHLFFNMFALFMFGRYIEQYFGEKKFLIYYIITGIGAAFVHTLVSYIQIQNLSATIPQEGLDLVVNQGHLILEQSQNYIDSGLQKMNLLINTPMVGASGAIFGILLAYGMLFPNTELIIFPLPIPVKAKYLVVFYGVLELFLGVRNASGDNVAHFAHLGGMIFGIIMIKLWKKKNLI